MVEQVPETGVLQAFKDHKLSRCRLAAQKATEQSRRAWVGYALTLRAAMPPPPPRAFSPSYV